MELRRGFQQGAAQANVCFIKFTLAMLRTDRRGPERQQGVEATAAVLLRTDGGLGPEDGCGDGEKVDLRNL